MKFSSLSKKEILIILDCYIVVSVLSAKVYMLPVYQI
jgi:hypothetical protein